MSCFTTKKKLSICKKAWKSLLSKMQPPKLPHFSRSKATTFRNGNQRLLPRKVVSPVYVDKLYIEASPSRSDDSIEMDRVEDAQEYHDLEDDREVVCSSIDSRFTSLQLHGVDAKAEEFIRKRREAWKIERQKSLDEYYEMLARGT